MANLIELPLKNGLIEYLNAIDSSVIMLESHKNDPVSTMANFGLNQVEQVALLSGNRVVVATVVGISAQDASPLDTIEINPFP
ncbi:hypothetical protein ACO0LM_05385 [Undibacterium sp. Di26W]|uniref:hypothetical protein n=1 Tax=Undibacterium sp. Di26W TaxID=3413035 RepID=UPI003BF018AB